MFASHRNNRLRCRRHRRIFLPRQQQSAVVVAVVAICLEPPNKSSVCFSLCASSVVDVVDVAAAAAVAVAAGVVSP